MALDIILREHQMKEHIAYKSCMVNSTMTLLIPLRQHMLRQMYANSSLASKDAAASMCMEKCYGVRWVSGHVYP